MTAPADTLPGLDLPDARVFLESSGPGMGEYSGDVLKARKPEVYRAAVQLLGRGYGIRDTAEILGVSARSVMAIRDREPASIATVKENTARRYLDVSQLAAEIARDRLLLSPDSVSFKDLMIGGAVATDKHLVLSGEATQRIEHVVRPADDDFTRMLADARRVGQVIEGELVEPDTGIAGGTAGPKGAPAPSFVMAASGPSAMPSLDTESSATTTNATPNEVLCVRATGYDTDTAAADAVPGPGPMTAAGEADRGGEGVGAATGLETSNESDHGEISRKGPV